MIKSTLINKLAKTLIIPFIALSMLFIAYGSYISLFSSPTDYYQKEFVRLMYIHVPSAWLGVAIYFFMSICSIIGFITKNPLCHLLTRAATKSGILCTMLCLFTGCIWGYHTWGTWWVWDARLTSMLILLFLYIGYIMIWRMIDDFNTAASVSSIINILGMINIPIIKLSVDWFNTLHQPASIIRSGGISIHPNMINPLVIMSIGLLLACISSGMLRFRTISMHYKIEKIKLRNISV